MIHSLLTQIHLVTLLDNGDFGLVERHIAIENGSVGALKDGLSGAYSLMLAAASLGVG